MYVSTISLATVCFFTSIANAGQSAEERAMAPQPLYRVTIVSRTTKAINYGYLTAPTHIGFRGTPLLADARGEATIQAKRGSTTIDAKFSRVPPPTRFGPQYLTYVAWAISTDGRPQNRLIRQFSGGRPIMGGCKIGIYTPPFLAFGRPGAWNKSI